MKERIQKIISSSGYCSRRAAEQLISEGRVLINGVTAQLGNSADSSDLITIDGNPLPRAGERTYIMLNKPRGYVTTMSDEQGRKTVEELTREVGVRVYPVGRLDLNSEGLLIMTDDGELANRLMHPSGEIKKTYHVRVRGVNLDSAIDILRSPMEIDGVRIKPAEVSLLKSNELGALLSITISEGRNRQVRKMCTQAELEILRLKRVSEGSLSLGKLPSGKWRYLTADELANLQKLVNR